MLIIITGILLRHKVCSRFFVFRNLLENLIGKRHFQKRRGRDQRGSFKETGGRLPVLHNSRKEKLDDLYFRLANYYRQAKFKIHGTICRKYQCLQKNSRLKGHHEGERCFIIGNSPSVNNQNLKLLRDETTFMVNRAFLHPDYEIIKPTYHVIVDPKLGTGEWDLDFLRQAQEKNSDVTFLLHADWYSMSRFEQVKRRYNIYWLLQTLDPIPNTRKMFCDLTRITYSMYVVEQAITAAMYMGFKDIYFTGVEGNGLFLLLQEQASHFYGKNQEDSTKVTDPIELSRALAHKSRWIRSWYYLSLFAEQHGHNIVNLTDGGILNMFKRDQFENVVLRNRLEAKTDISEG